jgi:osmotically inducible protein OsmC
MPQFSRNVTVDWSGPLKEGGKGVATAGTGAFNLPVTFPQRIGEPQGATSPEELIAAAHAACYAMVINAHVGRMGGSIGRTLVKCTVTADLSDAGIKIQSSKLELTVENLKGIDPAQFQQIAQDAEGKCPVSGALRGGLAIDVTATVK